MQRLLRTFLLFVLALLPARAAAQQAMELYWPNDEGRRWSYDQRWQSLVENPQIVNSQIRLVLDGPAYPAGSVLAQYLHHELVVGPPSPLQVETGTSDPLLQHLWIARPDLRGRIREHLDGLVCPANAPPGPSSVLLSGEFAFRKTSTEVAAWRCDLADTRSWQWLATPLQIGQHLFALQLVPDLADDVYLHAAVGAMQTATVPAGTFTNCLRVEYVVEYGESSCEDAEGNPTGTSKALTRGYILYATGVGPVEVLEEFLPYAEATGTCVDGSLVGVPFVRTTLKMTATTATLPTSWGALKVLYR